MKEELLICECSNAEHQLIFRYFEDEDWKEVYMTTHLSEYRNFWQRLKYAIKYVFGYKSRYGAFDEFIFRKEDADKLQSIVDYLKK